MTVQEIMDAVKELKVMELSELVKALEEEFGVSATPVAVAGAAAGAGDGAAAAARSARCGRGVYRYVLHAYRGHAVLQLRQHVRAPRVPPG